ncbi:MAG: protein kinase [Phycisphaerae bacterium]
MIAPPPKTVSADEQVTEIEPVQIAGYAVHRRLGGGGQGVVWLATHVESNRKVAVKIINRDRLADPHSRARFEADFSLLNALQHPNIVRTVERGALSTGELWHATEYVSGRMLTEHVDLLDARVLNAASGHRRRPQPIGAILRVFTKVCQAVEAAHQVGVIHRDLKPSNIIVDESGEPHLLDFGLAKGPGDHHASHLTLTGQFIGSPAWASPEQIAGRPSEVDTRSDVYSLGVILYRLLTDEFPYDVSGTLAHTFEQIQRAEPRPPRSISTDIARDLQAIMLRALAKDKQRRYQSVADFRDDLERYLDGRPVTARGDGALYSLAKFARLHRASSAALAASILFSVGYGIVSNVLYHRMAQYAEQARIKFRHAQQMAHVLVTEANEKLVGIAGVEGARKAILEKAYAELSDMTRERTDDPEMLADLGQSHKLLADIAGGLGNTKELLAHRKAALDIYESLAAAHPHDNDLQAAYSIALVGYGDVQHNRQPGDAWNTRRQAAREYYEKALAIDELLVQRDPANSHWRDNLCYSYERLGAVADDLGDHAAADRFRQKRHALAESLSRAEPHQPARLRNLCQSHQQMFESCDRAGDHATALEHWRRAAELAEQVLETTPDDARAAEQFIITHNLLSDLESQAGHFDQAAAAVERAAAQADRLHAAEPQRLLYSQLVGDSEHARALLARRSHRVDEAVAHYRRCGEFWRPMCDADPDSLVSMMRVNAVFLGIVETMSEADRANETRPDFVAWLDYFRRRAARLPTDSKTHEYLARAILRAPFDDLCDPHAAVAEAEAATRLPGGDCAEAWEILSTALEKAGDRAAAITALQHALDRLEPAAEASRTALERRLSAWRTASPASSRTAIQSATP